MGSAILASGKCGSEGLGGNGLAGQGGSGRGCLSGDGGSGVGGGSRSKNWRSSVLKLMRGSEAGAGTGDRDLSSLEDGNGLVVMGEELVISNKTEVCLGLHRNVCGCQPPVGFDVFRIHEVLNVLKNWGRNSASEIMGAGICNFW